MKPKFIYYFDWDLSKALSNRRKHGVDFDAVTPVFNDPLSITRPDSGYAGTEERWITIGEGKNSSLLVVVHTLKERDLNAAHIRIISARAATSSERWQYEHGHFSIHEEHDMQDEYDFSGGVRGKLYRENATFEIPIYLEPDVLAYFTTFAEKKGVGLEALLNEVLKADMERMKAAG